MHNHVHTHTHARVRPVVCRFICPRVVYLIDWFPTHTHTRARAQCVIHTLIQSHNTYMHSGVIEMPVANVATAFKNNEPTTQQLRQYKKNKNATDLVPVGYKFSRELQLDFAVQKKNASITMDGVEVTNFRRCTVTKKPVKLIGATLRGRPKDDATEQIMYLMWINHLDAEPDDVPAFKTPGQAFDALKLRHGIKSSTKGRHLFGFSSFHLQTILWYRQKK